jgi:hypothetical protein
MSRRGAVFCGAAAGVLSPARWPSGLWDYASVGTTAYQDRILRFAVSNRQKVAGTFRIMLTVCDGAGGRMFVLDFKNGTSDIVRSADGREDQERPRHREASVEVVGRQPSPEPLPVSYIRKRKPRTPVSNATHPHQGGLPGLGSGTSNSVGLGDEVAVALADQGHRLGLDRWALGAGVIPS